MIHAQKFNAAPVEFVKFKTTQHNVFAFLTALKKEILVVKSAQIAMRHGDQIVKFIVNVACATPKTIAVLTLRTHTFILTTMENARNYR